MHVECMRREEWWWSKIINNICVTSDHEIQDTLVFVYLDIHLAICQKFEVHQFYAIYFHLECILLILRNTSVVQAEVLEFAYTSANSIQSPTSETWIVSALVTHL